MRRHSKKVIDRPEHALKTLATMAKSGRNPGLKAIHDYVRTVELQLTAVTSSRDAYKQNGDTLRTQLLHALGISTSFVELIRAMEGHIEICNCPTCSLLHESLRLAKSNGCDLAQITEKLHLDKLRHVVEGVVY